MIQMARPPLNRRCLIFATVPGLIAPIFGAIACDEPEARSARTMRPARAADEGDGGPRTSAGFERRLSIVVAETGASPGAEAVERVMLWAFSELGLDAIGSADATPADLTLLIRYAARRGSMWGGIPSREILLELNVYDERAPDSLGRLVESASFADPQAERAESGALTQAAARLASRADRVLRSLPEEFQVAPPPAASPPTSAEGTVACLPIRNSTGRPALDGWCESLAAVAAEEYQRSGRYKIVERARLREVVADADVVAVVGGSADAMRRVSDKLGVDLLLVGETALRPDGNLVVSARLVMAQSAEVLHVVVVADRPDRIDPLEAAFRRKLRRPVVGWLADRIDPLGDQNLIWPAQSR
jgi:TolB-like protein